jgi:hypothetical protein
MQKNFIRDTRDDLHTTFMEWDHMLDRWQGVQTVMTEEPETLLKGTYRFLAQNFAKGKEWPLAGRR